MQQQAMMAGVYFKASEDIEVLTEYEGQTGLFFKTFAINDKRNKNGWKALWEGIKKNIHTFRERPGIEFMKCTADGCDLDHTEAQTKELSLEVQEPFRKSTIIATPIDEMTHTGYFVHKTEDAEFYDKIKKKEIKFVSPSIWPQAGGYEIIGEMENGQPMIDVWEWEGLHDAFVNKPAFGDEAKITATCEGDKCPIKLLSAKEKTAQLVADEVQNCVSKKIENYYTDGESPTKQKLAIFFSECKEQLSGILDTGDVQHLQQIPILVPHKKKKRFFTVSKKVYAKVAQLHASGKGVSESNLYDIIRKEEQNSSFNSCTCSGNQKMDHTEEEKLKANLKAAEEEKDDLKSKLSAMEDNEKEQHKAKVANFVAVLNSMEDDEHRDKAASAIRAMEDDKDMKAMDEAEKEVKTAKKGKSGQENDKKEEEQNAKIATLEATIAGPLIAKMSKARTLKGATDDEVKAFKASYDGKSLSAVEADYKKEEILINETLSAAEQGTESEEVHFAFQGAEGVTSLHAKSLEDIFEEIPA